ncbi:hypothetical protein WBP07_09475 [Novosphingobium sp. BL-8A]|uniref:hypothetical protein n=1 Tax=Novosphingobium sp. BL-8A TaxID=3127639 RepID=UPI003756516C
MRGQPVIALLAVLCGWVGGRLSAWEADSSFAAPAAHSATAQSGMAQLGMAQSGTAQGETGYRLDPNAGPQTPVGGFMPSMPPIAGREDAMPADLAYYRSVMLARRNAVGRYLPVSYGFSGADPAYPMHGRGDGAGDAFRSPELAQGGANPGRDFPRTLVDIRARERLPDGLPPLSGLQARPEAGDGTAGVGDLTGTQQRPVARRWSADAWALLRGSGPGPLANGALPATYGASQAGVVLRYRLSLASRYRPDFYMRATSTLHQMQRETAAALGIAVRPLEALPVIAAVEARQTNQGGRRFFQPAAMVITTLPPFDLASRLRGEAYVQAGYVAGTFATPFADGQFRVDHPLFRFGRGEGRIGGGVWGGAQKGVSRLDAGPSATIALPLTRRVYGRIGVDWRFRVAGAAEPDSGPALTLSAGF